jgi:elongator complex protein 6
VDGLTGLFLPKKSTAGKGENILSSPDLTAVSMEIQRSIQSLKDVEGGNVVLIIDQLDLLLAAGGDQIGAVNVGDMVMELREVRDTPRGTTWGQRS